MSTEDFEVKSGALKDWRSRVRLSLFTRFRANSDSAKTVSSEIKTDLSDKNTFFAWQRNHMANERTFLSWCRTGISLIGFGFIIERFDIIIREVRFVEIPGMAQHAHVPSTRYLGMTALGLGAVIIVLAGWRFYYIRRHINDGDPSFSVVPDTFLLGSVLLTVASAFVFFAFYF
jgi:putative membrane protein